LRKRLQAVQQLPIAEKAFEEAQKTGDTSALANMGVRYPKLPALFEKRTGQKFPGLQEGQAPPAVTRTLPSGGAVNIPQSNLSPATPKYPTNAADMQMRVQQDLLAGRPIPPALQYIKQGMAAAPFQDISRVDVNYQPQAAEAMGGVQYVEPYDAKMAKEYPYYNQAMEYYGRYNMTYDQAMNMAKTGKPPEKITERFPTEHYRYLSPQVIQDFIRTWGHDVSLGNVSQEQFNKELRTWIESGGTAYPTTRTPTLPPVSSPYLAEAIKWQKKLGIPATEIAKRLEMGDQNIVDLISTETGLESRRKGNLAVIQMKARSGDKKGAQQMLREYAISFGVDIPQKTSVWDDLWNYVSGAAKDALPPDIVQYTVDSWLESYVDQIRKATAARDKINNPPPIESPSATAAPTQGGPPPIKTPTGEGLINSPASDFWKQAGGVNPTVVEKKKKRP
jgi:hypothetical protein